MSIATLKQQLETATSHIIKKIKRQSNHCSIVFGAYAGQRYIECIALLIKHNSSDEVNFRLDLSQHATLKQHLDHLLLIELLQKPHAAITLPTLIYENI
jgi:hypothetical protein